MTVNLHIGTKLENLQLPTFRELLSCVPLPVLAGLNGFNIQVAAATHILRRYHPSPEQVSELSKHIPVDLTDLSDLDWCVGVELSLFFRKYALCGKHMENSTIREFIIADDFLTAYVNALEAGKDATTELYQIMGAICRPIVAKASADNREKLLSKEEAIHRGAFFQRHARSYFGPDLRRVAVICLYTILSTKNFINRTYMPLLSSGEGESNPINFGWHTVVMDIAENGAFGTISEVYDKGLHDIMVFCVKKSIDHRKTEKK